MSLGKRWAQGYRVGDDRLVVEARDYWHMEPGSREPHETWGR